MADYDKVHPGLSGPWQQSYKQTCEGQYDDETVSRTILKSLRATLKYYRDEPVIMLLRFAARVELMSQEPSSYSQIDWSEESREIERLAQQVTDGRKRGVYLALRIAKRNLQKLQFHLRLINPKVAIVAEYMREMYNANFEDVAPRRLKHHNNIDHTCFSEKLDKLRPFVYEGIDRFAEQAVKSMSVTSLRLPRRTRRNKPLDITQVNLFKEGLRVVDTYGRVQIRVR